MIEDVVSEPDRAAVRFTVKGTHLGNSLGFPATGKPAVVSGMFLARIRDGKIVESWNNFDRFGMLQQLGVVAATT